MKDSDRLVCIREFWNEIEASIAAALLQENGIECATQGGQIRTTLNYYGSVIEGVKVLVPEEDALRAEQILDEARDQPSEEELSPDDESPPGADFRSDPADDPATRRDTADEQARRLMRGGVLGFACVFLLLITIPLLLSIDKSQLTARGRRDRKIGIALLLLTILMWGLALTVLWGPRPAGEELSFSPVPVPECPTDAPEAYSLQPPAC